MFRRVRTVTIIVNDIDEAMHTYTDVLGLAKPVRSTEYPAGRYREHTLRIGDIDLDLIQPLDGPDAAGPGGGMARRLQRHGEGLYLVTVAVDDPEQYARGLEAKGVQVVWDVPDYGKVFDGPTRPATPSGRTHPLIHPRHTHGVLWELSRYRPDEKFFMEELHQGPEAARES